MNPTLHFLFLVILIVFCVDLTAGQSDCKRTSRMPWLCGPVTCKPSTGCSEPNHTCICVGDCGYTCVPEGAKCGKPPRPGPNVIQNYNSTAVGARVEYRCKKGFLISGAKSRTCNFKQKWDPVGPQCFASCSTPKLPKFAYLKPPHNKTGLKFKTGQKVVIGCRKGYSVKGNPNVMCFSGSWTLGAFECIANHSCPRTNRRPKARCTLECSPFEGCEVLGLINNDCLCDGTCGYSCIKQDLKCPIPRSINNGNVSYTSRTYRSSVNYTCEEGYSLRGPSYRVCRGKGHWSGADPSCDKDCSPPKVPENAEIFNPKPKYPSRTKVMFRCLPGFNSEGEDTTQCRHGSWIQGQQFLCRSGGCGKPELLNNGQQFGLNSNVGDQVTYRCNIGYKLKGQDARTCLKNGSWSGEKPVCNPVDCGKPTIPANGSASGTSTTFKSLFLFFCDDGFELVGKSSRRCQEDGKWTGKDIQCKAVDCGSLEIPQNGTRWGEITTFPNKVNFTCDKGFLLGGSGIRECLADGKWSGTKAFCNA